MQKLLDLYTSLLKVAGLRANADGYISAVLEDQSIPILINEKRLALPTQTNLNDAFKKDLYIFHPLSENIVEHKESAELARYRKALNIRNNYIFSLLCSELLVLCLDKAKHASLNPDQLEFLLQIKEIDDKTVETFNIVRRNMGMDDIKKCFVNIYLKRNGKVKSTIYNHAAIVSFPFYDELTNDDNKTVFGVTVRKKDKLIYKALVEFLMPNIQVKDHFNYGSTSNIAPFLDALMAAEKEIASRLNYIIVLFKDYISNADELIYDSKWVTVFDNLNQLLPSIRAIPMQTQLPTTNNVVKNNENALMVEPAIINTPVPQNPTLYPQVVRPPVQQPSRTSNGKLSYSELMSRSQPVQQQPFGQPQYNSFQMPGVAAQPVQRRASWEMQNNGFGGFGNNFNNNGFGNNGGFNNL